MDAQAINEQELRDLARSKDKAARTRFENLLEANRNSVVEKFFGIYSYYQKNFYDSIKYLSEFSKKEASDREALIFLMRAWYSSARGDEARRAAERVLAVEEENLEALRLLARLELNEREYARALPLWMRIAELKPDDAEAGLQVARIAWRENDFDLAARCAGAHLAVAAENAEALDILTKALHNLHRYPELAAQLPKLAGRNWTQTAKFLDSLASADALEPLALAISAILRNEQRIEDAVHWCEHLQSSWLTDAVSEELTGNDRAAARLYRAVLTVAPGNPEARNSLLRLMQPATKDLREAQKANDNASIISAANDLLALDPRCEEAQFALGRCFLVQGEHGRALEHLRQAVAGGSDNSWFQVNYGRAALNCDVYDEALDAFEAIVASREGEKSPHREEAAKSMARIHRKCITSARREIAGRAFARAWGLLHLAERAGPRNGEVEALRESVRRRMYSDLSALFRNTPGEAIQPARAFLELFPHDERALVIHGRLAMKARDYPSALQSWQRAAAAQPDNAHYHLQIARCHNWLKQMDEAAAAAQRVLELDPDIAEARSILGNARPQGA